MRSRSLDTRGRPERDQKHSILSRPRNRFFFLFSLTRFCSSFERSWNNLLPWFSFLFYHSWIHMFSEASCFTFLLANTFNLFRRIDSLTRFCSHFKQSLNNLISWFKFSDYRSYISVYYYFLLSVCLFMCVRSIFLCLTPSFPGIDSLTRFRN